MHLKLEKLQRVVKQVVDDERMNESLRVEIDRVLSPAIVAEGRIDKLIESVNDWMDVLEHTGRASRLTFKPSVMIKFLDHANPSVRKFAARVVPEKFLSRLINDKSNVVRSTAAKRMSLSTVREMLKRFPKDDDVRIIYKQKKLSEAGIPQPKINSEPFSMYATKLGDTVKQNAGIELSELWYRELAYKFMQDYGGNIEDGWEELATRRYVSSVKATSGVEIDEVKLLNAVKDLIKEREERALKRDALKETLDWLKTQDDCETLLESTLTFDENVDSVSELFESNTSPTSFIDKVNELFNVKESLIPSSLLKHVNVVGESFVPVVATLPHKNGFRIIDERVLDMYCSRWNDQQRTKGESLKLEWSTHPGQIGKISFNVTLK